jgi:acyl-CoA synthetase (AMP-forming)/AMP-acid ligase II
LAVNSPALPKDLPDFGLIADLSHQHALHQPEHPARVEGERQCSYAALEALMDRVAGALQRDGVRPGEAIAIAPPAVLKRWPGGLVEFYGMTEGMASVQRGATPVAFMVRKAGDQSTAQDLLDWVSARVRKTQRLAAVHLIDELPRSAIGKVLKREPRDHLNA